MNGVSVYAHTASYAREHGELQQYRQSRSENIDCKIAIEKAVNKNFDGRYLDGDAVKSVLEQFGEDRVAYVLASTIQVKEWDGRFSPSNKKWATSVSTVEDVSPLGDDHRIDWSVEIHSAVLDGFVDMFRREVEIERKVEPPPKDNRRPSQVQKDTDEIEL